MGLDIHFKTCFGLTCQKNGSLLFKPSFHQCGPERYNMLEHLWVKGKRSFYYSYGHFTSWFHDWVEKSKSLFIIDSIVCTKINLTPVHLTGKISAECSIINVFPSFFCKDSLVPEIHLWPCTNISIWVVLNKYIFDGIVPN